MNGRLEDAGVLRGAMPAVQCDAARRTRLIFAHPAAAGFVSVIIPVHADAAGLADTLRSLAAQTLPPERFEVLVANDGADGQVEAICRSFGVSCIALSPRQGSYAARAAALAVSRGSIIAFMDADEIADPAWLEAGIAALADSDYAGGAVEIDAARLRTPADYYEYLCAFDVPRMLRESHYAPTANLFVRRTLFEELGGFDTMLESGGDLEFGDRVHRAGRYRMRYAPAARTVHPPRGSRRLFEKARRVRAGLGVLAARYPDRFARFVAPLRSVGIMLGPVYRSVAPCKRIPFFMRLRLPFFALRYGIVNAYYHLTVTRAPARRRMAPQGAAFATIARSK